MLSMINLLKDYNNNRSMFLRNLRNLKKEDLYEIYKNADTYEKEILYKNLKEETLITLIDLILHRLNYNKNVSNVVPELKYKGKMPEYNKKKLSEIAKQLDSEEKY